MVVIVFVIVVIGEGPRKRFQSDESGKRQIGVSGVEGERVWKRAGGSAAAAGCWGHFLFGSFWFFFGMDFWEGLEGLVIFVIFDLFIWMVFVDAVNIDVCCCCLYYFFFSTFKSGPC